MTWLLNRFYAHRILCDQLRREADARIAAEDKVRELQARLMEAKTELADARLESIKSAQTVADWASQFAFGRKIYAEVPNLPQESPEAPILPKRRQGRSIVNQLTEELYEKLALAEEMVVPEVQ